MLDSRQVLAPQRGFTLIEVMVAIFVLTYNSASAPGLYIVANGKVSGTHTFYGVIYDAKATGIPDVIEISGSPTIRGALSVDGGGGVSIAVSGLVGSDPRPQIFYDENAINAINAIRSFGTGSIVQNTWREIPGG